MQNIQNVHRTAVPQQHNTTNANAKQIGRLEYSVSETAREMTA